MATIIKETFLTSTTYPVLVHHDTNKADRRIKYALCRAKIDWLEPMSTQNTKRLIRAINIKS